MATGFDLAAAKGLRVGVIDGSAILPRLEELGFTRLVKVKNAALNARMLHRSRIDAIIESEWVDTYAWKQAGFKAEDLVPVLNISAPIDIYLAAGKDFPSETVIKIRSAMSAAQASGDIQKILRAWY